MTRIDWHGSILTWEYFRLPFEGGPESVEVGLVSLDGRPFGSVFPDRKLLATRELAEVLAMSAGAQFLPVPYTRALVSESDALATHAIDSAMHRRILLSIERYP